MNSDTLWRLEYVGRTLLGHCVCGAVGPLLLAQDTPITFDAGSGRYFIEMAGKRHEMRYCVSCGGLLVPATRKQRYRDEDPAEVRDVENRLAGMLSVRDVVREFGEATAVHVGDDSVGWTMQYDFRDLYLTLDVVIRELKDGRLWKIHLGKSRWAKDPDPG